MKKFLLFTAFAFANLGIVHSAEASIQTYTSPNIPLVSANITETVQSQEQNSSSSYDEELYGEYGSEDSDVLQQIEDIMLREGGIVDYGLRERTLLTYPQDRADFQRITRLIETREDRNCFIGQVDDVFIGIREIDSARQFIVDKATGEQRQLRFKLCTELGTILCNKLGIIRR